MLRLMDYNVYKKLGKIHRVREFARFQGVSMCGSVCGGIGDAGSAGHYDVRTGRPSNGGLFVNSARAVCEQLALQGMSADSKPQAFLDH